MSATTTIKNTSKGGLVLPLGGDGLLIAAGEEVPVSADDLAKARKLPVVASWFDDRRLVVVGGDVETSKPTAKPTKSKTATIEG